MNQLSIYIKYVLCTLLLHPLLAKAQTSNTRNYIRVWKAHAPETDPSALPAKGLREVKQTTTYFDGLGRPEQSVVKKGSLFGTNSLDLVSLVVYDEFGRETLKYLPYVANAGDGLYKNNALTEQNNFFTSLSSPIAGQGESHFYNKTVFESSPLNRKIETFAPGISWSGTSSNINEDDRHSVKLKYWVNTITDEVRIWQVSDGAGGFGSYNTPTGIAGIYPAGTLFKTVTIDEKGGQVIEFKDKEGKVVLKKVQLTASADNGGGSSHNGWLCTYYIYDDLGNLRCVVPPKAVEQLGNSWQFTSAILDELCFRYEYDERKRMIMKKVPGAEKIWMVYDARDRLVMTQDGNMRPGKWLVTLYDALNRPVITGFITYNSNFPDMQELVTDLTTGSTPPSGLQNDVVLPNAEYISPVSGNFEAANSITLNEGFESGTEFTAQIINSGPIVEGMPVNKNPLPPGVTLTVLTKTGYDNYLSLPSVSGLTDDLDIQFTGSNYLITSYNSAPNYAETVTKSMSTKGLVTWTQTKVLDGSPDKFLYAVNIYDEKGRLIQVKKKNITGGTDVTTTQYSFSNQPLVTVHKEEKSQSNSQSHIIVTKMEYDDLGRLTVVKKSVNSTINGFVINQPLVDIVSNEYDVLGQLKTKKLSPAYNSNAGLETLNYDYNIRGWMLGMNRSYTADGANNENHYFGFELGYDKTTAMSSSTAYSHPQYNGNIGGTIWKSRGDGIQRKYDYRYDNVDRLDKAEFVQHNSNGNWDAQEMNFSVLGPDADNDYRIKYDANGNIMKMQQWAWKTGGNELLDNLIYHYLDNGNKLKNVIDGANDPQTTLGDFRSSQTYINGLTEPKSESTIDYDYDANGNLVLDKNKDIASITYNHLNLPYVITISGKGSIEYVYDASGAKLKKIVHENGLPDKTTLYLYGIYENDNLQLIPHEEGRIRPLRDANGAVTSYTMDYFVRDHLGNVRMVLTEEILQDIYPAATLEGSTANDEDAIAVETQYYVIEPANVVDKSIATGISNYQNNNGVPNNNPKSHTTALSKKLYKLKATNAVNGGATGLGITLKVMSGDKIDIWGKSYYFDNNTGRKNYSVPAEAILAGLLGSPGVDAGNKIIGAGVSGREALINEAVNAYLKNPERDRDKAVTKPRAGINWILFDNNFKYVMGSFDIVGAANELKHHALSNIQITKNGYLYVYASNESPVNVYFDNLQVAHTHGHILEETHYYPFGLTMAGISSKAIGRLENRYKFNGGTELNSSFDIHLYETNFRGLDPQVGRFWQVDPYADVLSNITPYNYASNNPILRNDPLGLQDTTINGEEVKRDKDLAEVTVTSRTAIPNEFLAHLRFRNPGPYQVASFKDWPFTFNVNHDLVSNFATGWGASRRVYLPNHPMTKRLKNAQSISFAKAFFYKKYATDYKNGRTNFKGASVTNYQGFFGLPGLLSSGTDIVEQFVGSMSIDIFVDEAGKNFLIFAENNTSATSAFYHMANDRERVPGQLTPLGNMYQIYMWSEPIIDVYFEEALEIEYNPVKYNNIIEW